MAIRPGELLLIISSSPLGRHPACGTQPWLQMGKVKLQAEQHSFIRPTGPKQMIAVSEEQARAPLALKIKILQDKMNIQGPMFKSKKNCHKRY